MTIQRIGYGRVSTVDQNHDSQRDALTAAGVHKLYVEKITGTKADRPELNKARDTLRAGDTLVITRLDRLGRSTKDLLTIAADLNDLGVNLEVLEQHINTKTAEGRLFFTMIAAFAEFEHDMMRSRTADGLAAAKARGRQGGRPPKITAVQIAQAKQMRDSGDHTMETIAQTFNVTRATIYRVLAA